MKNRFEWGAAKAAANIEKHGVSFLEAITAFDDPDRMLLPDPWHSTLEEVRELLIGMSDEQRELLIVYTERDPITRIISARLANRRERITYYESQKKSTEDNYRA